MKKKIFLVLFLSVMTLGVYAQTETEKSDFNKWSIDFGAGFNRPYNNFAPGYSPASISLWSGSAGVRYMFNEYFGLRTGFGFDSFEDRSTSLSFDSEQYNLDMQGFINLGRVLNFNDWTNRLNLLVHGGLGIGLGKYGNSNTDWVKYPISGVMIEMKLTPRVALFADASAQMNFNQKTGFDGNHDNLDNVGDIVRGMIGFSVSLGKHKKRADFYTKDNHRMLSSMRRQINYLSSKVKYNENRLNADENAIDGLKSDYNKLMVPDNSFENMPMSDDMSEELINNGFLNVYFKLNSTDVAFSYIKNVVFLKNYMEKNPSFKLEVSGYADELGTVDYNLKLSQKRANVVKELLKDHGIDGSRIMAKGKGKLSVDKKVKYGMQMARKVSFLIIK